MVVFADAVGDVDEAAFDEVELRGALAEVPADGADGCDGRGGDGQAGGEVVRGWRRPRGGRTDIVGGGDLRGGDLHKFEAQVVRFHDATRGNEARVAGDEDGLRVSMAEWLELAQPSGENWRDAVEGQLGVDVQETLGLSRSEMDARVSAQTELEIGKFFSGQCEADGESVAAEAGEEVGAGFNGGEEREAIDGAAGAVSYAVLHADNDGRLGGALDDARSENADNAAMPAIAVDDEETVGDDFFIEAETRFNHGEGSGFNIAALAVEALEFCGKFGGSVRVARCE